MLRLLIIVLLSLFVVSYASADNFHLLTNGKPTECHSYGPPNRVVTCFSESVLVNSDTSKIYRCFSNLWLQYDETTGKIGSGGGSRCLLPELKNYPTNPGKSNYSFLHDEVGPEPAKRPDDVYYQGFTIAKSEVFSFTACMSLTVNFSGSIWIVHSDCIGAQEPTAITTLEDLRLFQQQMMQDRPKNSR
jgi:hypothetical protein